MGEKTNLLSEEVARMAARNRLLNFVEEHEAEVTAWLADWDYSYSEFLKEFRDEILPWALEEEVEELAEAATVTRLMEIWDELMDCHPHHADRHDRIDVEYHQVVLREARQGYRLKAQVSKLREENRELRAKVGI